jgi:hypothetical protein
VDLDRVFVSGAVGRSGVASVVSRQSTCDVKVTAAAFPKFGDRNGIIVTATSPADD